jgi:hypothetical protein
MSREVEENTEEAHKTDSSPEAFSPKSLLRYSDIE